MRIKRLDIKAFGPFTEKVLEFPVAEADLHIIYGPNEAGKSSTLRALTAWLYGFDERTTDNFIHPNDQLLVGGLLENGKGEDLFIARRKKRKADLLDADGEPIGSSVLSTLLQGVDQNTFKQLFGLDHEALVRGGTDILKEKGSAATSLFSAGTGVASVQQILTDLKEESEKIFKGRAAKPTLNAAIRSFADLKREIHKKSLPSSKWREHDKALRHACKELEQEQEKRRELDRERRRLERIQNAVNPLTLRRDFQNKLAELGEVPFLPEDFPVRRQESQARLRSAEQTITGAERRLKELQDKAEGIELNTELLDQAETIQDLHQRLGEYRKGQTDLPILEGKRVQEKTTAGNILRSIRQDLPLEKAEDLRPLLRRRRSIKEIGGKLPILEEKAASAARIIRKVTGDKEQREKELKTLPMARDIRPLDEAISSAQKLGDLDSDIQAKESDLSNQQKSLDWELKENGLWCGSPTELLEVIFPKPDTIQRFGETFRNLNDDLRTLREKREEALERKKRIRRDIAVIEKAGEVPTEDELDQKRRRRDQGWTLLRRQWLDGEDVSAESQAYHPESDLPTAYEEYVEQADGIADRLRREAERVHKYASLSSDLECLEDEIAEFSEKESVLEEKIDQEKQRWSETWQPCGVTPLPPSEMSKWISKIDNLRIQARQIIIDERKIRDLQSRRRKSVEALRKSLQEFQTSNVPEGEDLAPLLQEVRKVHDSAVKQERRREALHEKLEELESKISETGFEAEQAEKDLTTWKGEWSEVLAELGLPEKETPLGVEDFFDNLEACIAHLEKSEDFQKRIHGIERDAAQLKEKVRGLLETVAPELISLDIDQAIERLNGLLSRAREDEVTWKNIRESIDKAEEEIREALSETEIAEAELAELCRLAKCESREDLEDAERKWQEHVRLKERLDEEEERILKIADGLSLEELEEQAGQVDPDVLPSQLTEISEKLDQIHDRIEEISKRIGNEEKELALMDGSAEAARMADEAEEQLAGMRRMAERYIRLRVAARVLEEEVERYRAENQDPVLKLAAGYFSELTLGSFDGLRTDVDDKGEQVIVGLRNGGERVVVDAMSSGTRDQLFLALRLGSLEHRLQKSAPIPFIVDDILINFDEERTEATLKALSRLALKTQVILFSHHKQILESSKNISNFISLEAC